MWAIDLALRATAHAEFLTRAEESAINGWSELSAYVKAHGIDLISLARLEIAFGLTDVAFFGTRFDFVSDDERDAERAAVIEVVAADAETIIDYAAWSTTDPMKFATLFGFADALGEEHVVNPATYFGGKALRVRRTPLQWLQAQCQGVVVLNPASSQRWLADAPGLIAVEDIQHAREIGRWLHPFFDPKRIVFPRPRKEKRDAKRA